LASALKKIIKYDVKKVIVFIRDELKQYEMAQEYTDSRLRFFIGDVRYKDRLYRAFDGIDAVVLANPMKQVPAFEYNPFEAAKTNIYRAHNITEAAIDRGGSKSYCITYR